ncbi:MAG: hypothetical protein HOM14_14070 [Gammaproteobacteria bacterium]|jgi:hypothetical protein|nr:hypothetical protein [Gammaproteobacteria bacterium]MBT3721822.1 hypothetical protein [Gammaproteobacteria bacterium]MBT4078337.1 hypothetical protein [Gammaproteobacteria bacterium]MBT4196102.1 hypothetical protein [Gammaproteobacteria bacterium]MBT4451782.1 hypothetical protein [Gammaproteobacteria bacterium]
MGLDKLIKKLKQNLNKGTKSKNEIRCEQIDSLLEKLKKKERELKNLLADENDKSERKHLKLELKIASVERKKGLKRRAELKKKCK